MKRHQRVNHRPHSDQGEEPRRDTTDGISEVEEPHRQATEDDGEVQPGEERALVGEEDFGSTRVGRAMRFPAWMRGLEWGRLDVEGKWRHSGGGVARLGDERGKLTWRCLEEGLA